MYTVLICDDNANWLEILSLAIDKDSKLKVVAQACDGETALELIERLRPDIIILDIVMPEYDGVYIVSHIRKHMNEYTPFIYILSGLGTDSIIKALNNLGIDFYSVKPVSTHVIMNNLNALIERHNHAEVTFEGSEEAKSIMEREILENVVKNLLLRFGVMPHRISSKCVMNALVLYAYSPESFPILTKVLYPQIAEEYGLSNSSVEKNIRSAISQIQKNNTEVYSEIFSYSTKGRITNGEFLSVMADYINNIVRNGRLRTKK